MGKTLVFILLVGLFIVFLIFRCNNNIENFDTTSDAAEAAVKKLYQADVGAIRTLADVATKLQTNGYTCPGKLGIGGMSEGMLNIKNPNGNYSHFGWVNNENYIRNKTTQDGELLVNGPLNVNGTANVNGSANVSSHLVAAGDLVTNRQRIRFWDVASDHSNHTIYNNNSNIDGEGVYDGIKMNVYAGLKIRTGNANGTVPAEIVNIQGDSINLNVPRINLGNGWNIRTGDGQFRLYYNDSQQFVVHNPDTGNEWYDVVWAKRMRTEGEFRTGDWKFRNVESHLGLGNVNNSGTGFLFAPGGGWHPNIGGYWRKAFSTGPNDCPANWAGYHNRYPDLQNAFGGDQNRLGDHYNNNGRNEGRNPC